MRDIDNLWPWLLLKLDEILNKVILNKKCPYFKTKLSY